MRACRVSKNMHHIQRVVARGCIASLIFLCSGCSFLNFSANYYEPPGYYQDEVSFLWKKLQKQLTFKNTYQVRIVDGKASDKLNGIPAISGQTVMIPNDFIKYVYQNYYDHRFKILASVMVHEMTHTEYGLPSKPVDKHVQVDFVALKLLSADNEVAADYYRSLFVMKNYWFARKGVAGHALNAGWNAANAASLILGGPAMFADWYATDLSGRMKLITKRYQLKSIKCFERSVAGDAEKN